MPTEALPREMAKEAIVNPLMYMLRMLAESQGDGPAKVPTTDQESEAPSSPESSDQSFIEYILNNMDDDENEDESVETQIPAPLIANVEINNASNQPKFIVYDTDGNASENIPSEFVSNDDDDDAETPDSDIITFQAVVDPIASPIPVIAPTIQAAIPIIPSTIPEVSAPTTVESKTSDSAPIPISVPVNIQPAEPASRKLPQLSIVLPATNAA